MKYLVSFLVLAGIAMPAMAESDAIISTEPAMSADVVETEDVTNPGAKFPNGLQFGMGVSATSGLNGFVGYNNKKFDSFWWKRLGFRFDFATTRPVKSLIDKGIDKGMGNDGVEIGDYLTIKDGELKSYHVAALLDVYPFGDTWFLGGWRLTGGYVFGDLDLDANLTGQVDGVPTDEIAFKLGGNEYKYVGNTINGKAHADWKYHGPYAGTGFDIGLFAGFKIYLDAGVVFTNKAAQLGLDVPVQNLFVKNGTSWVAVNTPVLEAALEQAKGAALADAQDELDKYKFYPMVKLGFMYRF